MKRRRKVPCDPATPLRLIQQYQEVLHLRRKVVLAETDQHAANQPSDDQRADATGTERSAHGSRPRYGSDPHSEQVE